VFCAFLSILDDFDGLMMVVWMTETGNHFHNIVVYDRYCVCFIVGCKQCG
jgi:hypothetical protein